MSESPHPMDYHLPAPLRTPYVRKVLRQNQVAGIGVGSCTPANASSADFSFDRSFEALWTPCVHASHMLPRLMAHYRPRRLVEVGVCTGMTSITAMIAAHRLDHSLQNYFMVDPWRAPSCVPGCGCFKELLRVAAHVPAMTLLRGYSLPSARMIPNASLDLAYIDAAHKYNSAREVSLTSRASERCSPALSAALACRIFSPTCPRCTRAA